MSLLFELEIGKQNSEKVSHHANVMVLYGSAEPTIDGLTVHKRRTRGMHQFWLLLRIQWRLWILSFGIVGLLVTTTLGCERGMMQEPTQVPIPLQISARNIINGTPDLTQPAIGALTPDKRSPFCTGTLITSQLVLTAAHCISSAQQYGINRMYFRVDFPQSDGKYTSEYHAVQQLVTHPQYNGGSNGHEYDLGLMILTKKVTNVTPIPALRIPMDQAWVGTTVHVVGYGQIQTQPSIQSADRKYAADIPILRIDPRSFIHIDTQTKKSACHGDSGGPSLYKTAGREFVVGITSVAYNATSAGTPGQTYCDGGAISTRPDAHPDFLRPYLIRYGDGPEPCSSDPECGACGTCPTPGTGQQQVCVPIPVTPETYTCKACSSDKDCGLGVCYRFSNGYRCLQACTKDSCCPDNSYCAPGLKGVPALKNYCFPIKDVCPDLPCAQDSDCGAGEVCTNKVCKPNPPPRSASYCQPCHSSSQCGPGNFCYNSTTTTGYCVQGCGAGRFCPDGASCHTIAPGIDQCMPIDGCFRTCKLDDHCPQGYKCTNEKCIRPTGGISGDFCNSQIPCQSLDHVCSADSFGERCIKRCGSPPGTAGNRCEEKKCQDGLYCMSLGDSVDICVETCTSTCSKGGRCFQLTRSTQVCLCQSDGDCNTNQFCNYAVMGIYGAGACSPRPPDTQTQCRPGETCRPSPPSGNFCRASVGDRPAFASCSAQDRCVQGLDCLNLSSQYPPTCFENCAASNACQHGGTCVTFRSGAKYCLCQNNNQCPKGTNCVLIARSGQGEVGFCDRSSQIECGSDKDCPAEHACKNNTCAFDPTKTNEPWPETHPEAIPDGGSEAALPEQAPTEAPTVQETITPPEPAPEPVVAPEPTNAAEPPPTPDASTDAGSTTVPSPPGMLRGGCSCDSFSPISSPFGLGLLLLFVGFGFFRRRIVFHTKCR